MHELKPDLRNLTTRTKIKKNAARNVTEFGIMHGANLNCIKL